MMPINFIQTIVSSCDYSTFVRSLEMTVFVHSPSYIMSRPTIISCTLKWMALMGLVGAWLNDCVLRWTEAIKAYREQN